MFDKTYYATHPDMMECVSNEELRERYLISDLFCEGECVLNSAGRSHHAAGLCGAVGTGRRISDRRAGALGPLRPTCTD